MFAKKEPQLFKTVILSLIGFVLLWAVVTDAWGYSSHIASPYGYYIYAFICRTVWVAPAVWLIIRYSAFLNYSKRELFSRPVLNGPLATVLAVAVIVPLVSMMITHGGFWINKEVCIPLELLNICVVGFVEEIVFRGWGYNALSAIVSSRKAVFYSTLFFVLLHSPAYLVRFYRFGSLDYMTWITQSVTTAICGIVFCWLFKKSKTIWNPIILHIIYDVMTVLFVGG